METPKDPNAARVLASGELFAGDKAVWIDHDGTIYRLSITRQGKLILNK